MKGTHCAQLMTKYYNKVCAVSEYFEVYCAALLQRFSVPACNVHMCYQSPDKSEYQIIYLNIDAFKGFSIDKITLMFKAPIMGMWVQSTARMTLGNLMKELYQISHASKCHTD